LQRDGVLFEPVSDGNLPIETLARYGGGPRLGSRGEKDAGLKLPTKKFFMEVWMKGIFFFTFFLTASLAMPGLVLAGDYKPDLEKGKQVYEQVCHTCHGPGIAGAPKFGDKESWKEHIAKGMDTLFGHAINGYEAMPAKGGDSSLSDEAVKDAVSYMVKNSQ
jgi:cytochrome c5